jgi:lipid-A-disaccharide synthase
VSPKTLYLICGEASADLHTANLAAALKQLQPDIRLMGTGGDRMAEAGVEIRQHIREMNFMGFVEVIANLPRILNIMKCIKQDILTQKPDAVLLVDYPGMNLKLAPWIRARGIPVYYYISPQLWAWKKSRVEIIKKYINRMFVVLPFEVAFYETEGVRAEFYGHPLLDEFEKPLAETSGFEKAGRPILAVLPGSRAQEIRKILPVFIRAALRFPGYEPVIACAPAISQTLYDDIPETKGIRRVVNQTRELLRHSNLALVASGTATLEAALAGVPQVVGYKANPVSVYLAKRMVKVKYISLVNLILDKSALKELIQEDLNEDNLVKALAEVSGDTSGARQIQEDYAALKAQLGGAGCSERIAKQLLEAIR